MCLLRPHHLGYFILISGAERSSTVVGASHHLDYFISVGGVERSSTAVKTFLLVVAHSSGRGIILSLSYLC
jgi:hypothetical protein